MITIRTTTKEEALQLSEIQRQAFLPLYERYHDEGTPCFRGIEDVENRLNSPNFKYYTIFEDEEIVGGILYKCKGKGPFFDQLQEGEYYLQRVYIKPEYQCKGIAQTAILLCEKELTDAKMISVDFPEDLAKNRRCYEKAGFVDTGKRLEAEPGLVLACFEKYIKKENNSMEPCAIRFVRTEDYRQVENLMKQVQELHVSWRPDIYKPCDVVLPETAFFEEVKQETMLVAEFGGKVVGLCAFMHRHIETDKQVTRDVLFIDVMVVDEAYRGMGIGHQLFDSLKELVKERQVDGIELQVNARNKAAYEMYIKYGFTEKSINMELL